MKLTAFDFHLPQHLIAQTPISNRSDSRLLLVDRAHSALQDVHFYDVLDYLQPGDVLVRNNTRVLPARLFGTKEGTGAHVELLLLREDNDIWECLVGNAKTVKLDTVISFHDGSLRARCVAVKDKGIRHFEMLYEGIFLEILDRLGNVPLPPYIHEQLEDKERYQTVYAKVQGSAAAPTAGLHFNQELFQKLADKGVEIVDITLHIGLGTFRPVDVEDILEHTMHEEFYVVSEQAADTLNHAKAEKRRIIAVGTTSTRVLETQQQRYQSFHAETSSTDIFIYPGYTYKAIDGLITNFHLPKSTLIMLVYTFGGDELMKQAYAHAIEEQYRFFSFGDSMFIY